MHTVTFTFLDVDGAISELSINVLPDSPPEAVELIKVLRVACHNHTRVSFEHDDEIWTDVRVISLGIGGHAA